MRSRPTGGAASARSSPARGAGARPARAGRVAYVAALLHDAGVDEDEARRRGAAIVAAVIGFQQLGMSLSGVHGRHAARHADDGEPEGAGVQPDGTSPGAR